MREDAPVAALVTTVDVIVSLPRFVVEADCTRLTSAGRAVRLQYQIMVLVVCQIVDVAVQAMDNGASVSDYGSRGLSGVNF